MQAAPNQIVVLPVSSSPFSLKCSIRTVLSAIVGVLIFVGFIMQLVSVGKRHDDCKEWRESLQCRDIFRLYWWTCFFEIIVAVVTLVFLAIGFIETTRTFLSTFLAVSTSLCMLAVERFLDDENNSTARSAVAGYIFSTMGNFLLIFLVGVEPKRTSMVNNGPAAAATPLQPIPSAHTSTQPPVSSHLMSNYPPVEGSLISGAHQTSNCPPVEGSLSVATQPTAPPEYRLRHYIQGVPVPPSPPKY